MAQLSLLDGADANGRRGVALEVLGGLRVWDLGFSSRSLGGGDRARAWGGLMFDSGLQARQEPRFLFTNLH